jgi:modulator of FtsH protease HflC
VKARLLLVLASLAIGCFVVSQSLFLVREGETLVKLRLGRRVDTPLAPGLHAKWPLVERVEAFDTRLVVQDFPNESLTMADGRILSVDFYVAFRIADAWQYYRSTGGNAQIAAARVAPIVRNALKAAFARRSIEQLAAADTNVFDDAASVDVRAAQALGLRIADVGVRRIDLPEGVSRAVYRRMTANFTRDAGRLRAEGEADALRMRAEAERSRTEILSTAGRDAERVRGEGDAAAASIWAGAVGRDVDFYTFYRRLQAYRRTLGKENDVFVLSPDSGFYKYFKDPAAR